MRFILAFVLLLSLATGAFAQWGIGAAYYGVSIPAGDMRDFVGDTSWRGFGIEGRKFLSDKASVGIDCQWNTIDMRSDDLLSLELMGTTGHASGDQFRRVYATPVLVTGQYYLQSAEGYRNVLPYLGVGLGACWIEKRIEMGIVALENSNWHFALVPEGGVVIPMGYGSNLLFGLKYNYAFEKGDEPAYSYWNVNIGIACSR
jgi:hypothetical protein